MKLPPLVYGNLDRVDVGMGSRRYGEADVVLLHRGRALDDEFSGVEYGALAFDPPEETVQSRGVQEVGGFGGRGYDDVECVRGICQRTLLL